MKCPNHGRSQNRAVFKHDLNLLRLTRDRSRVRSSRCADYPPAMVSLCTSHAWNLVSAQQSVLLAATDLVQDRAS